MLTILLRYLSLIFLFTVTICPNYYVITTRFNFWKLRNINFVWTVYFLFKCTSEMDKLILDLALSMRFHFWHTFAVTDPTVIYSGPWEFCRLCIKNQTDYCARIIKSAHSILALLSHNLVYMFLKKALFANSFQVSNSSSSAIRSEIWHALQELI